LNQKGVTGFDLLAAVNVKSTPLVVLHEVSTRVMVMESFSRDRLSR
jgi:hypothetical protein